ncbi:virulence factor TspB C-terminal domain-related protein, partial [Acinetobacter ursingii]|uniref:virulence factor TspB C-terminal domain-related protein n=1 Tax=Acinetobacter ursingii TaxID=108980 RepID=UPI00244864D6
MLGGAAVQLLLDGAGWVMDPANNSIKMPNPDAPGPTLFYISSVKDQTISNNAESACKKYASMLSANFERIGHVNGNTLCYLDRWSAGFDVLKINNPNYNPDNPDNYKPVLNDDLADALQKGADAGDPAAQQLIKDAYQAVDALGNATKDLGAAVDGLNDAVKDLTDAFDKIVKSDDPVATGNTDSIPSITTGGEASGDTDTQNKDKDGNDTGSSNSTSNFQLPAFCDWAADNCEWHQEDKKHQADQKTFWDIVTDWFDWTKDESDLPEKDDTDLNITTDFEEKKVSLNVSAQCPAPTYETVVLHGVTAQVKTSDYSFICSLDWLIKPFVIGFSMVTACFILFGFQRGGEE